MPMKPSQLALFLAAAITKRLPILIVGSPGIAKTSIVRQATVMANNKLTISHPGIADPTDAKGFPWIENGKASFVPFGDIRALLDSTEPTVWFMDDLGQAPAAVQASYMPWILDRGVNGNYLPDHVTIFAATNRRTDRAGVSGILEPVKSRFASIVELEPDLEEWGQWAITDGAASIPPVLLAFLRFRSGYGMLNKFEASADLKNSPIPRTWENAGKLLQLDLPAAVEQQAIAGAVGEGAATELLAFVSMFRQLPSIDAILVDPNAAVIPTQPNILYAVTTALASRATDRNVQRVFRYGERLVEAGHGEFATLLVRDVLRRKPELQQTAAFVTLMAGELGQMIGGGAAGVR